MRFCIGKSNVYVIGKMIRVHKFCYSHLIMINTLYTCTVQVRVLYTVHYSVQYYFWARLNFIWGGLHTVQYRVYHYFLLGSILFGGLKPPQALMTPPLIIAHSHIHCTECTLYMYTTAVVLNLGYSCHL